MTADNGTLSRDDARAALGSVGAMAAAAQRRGGWPAWLSLAVAAAFGVNGVILALGQTWTHKFLASAVVMALTGLAMWFRRARGAALRSDMRRWVLAVVLNVIFILFSSLARGPLAFGGAGPFLYGAAEMAVILIAFAVIAVLERR